MATSLVRDGDIAGAQSAFIGTADHLRLTSSDENGRAQWRSPMFRRPLAALIAASLMLALAARPSHADFRSYAVVQDDATMVIQNKLVRLYGIYIPQNAPFCGQTLRPTVCGNRAAVALDFKIQGFVTCREMGAYTDGSISAICWTGRSNFNEGEDLGAYLINQGLALAGPDAPFEYRALERIAQNNGVGVWGFQADAFSRGRLR
jgi:endonuclease YncB( thermonuclease family)